jgi:glycine dehydrogenase subunit 2
MSMNRQGRVSRPEAEAGEGVCTHTGNRALMLEEPLIFEIGDEDTTGVDLPQSSTPAKAGAEGGRAHGLLLSQENSLFRNRPIGLPGLSEPETVRHYTRLSRQNYAIDLGLFPLGSCTMKHNPRLNEKMARLPGFADIHPLQPQETVQGAFALIHLVADWLCKLTGMPAVARSCWSPSPRMAPIRPPPHSPATASRTSRRRPPGASTSMRWSPGSDRTSLR